MITATAKDYKVGAILQDKRGGWQFEITKKYDEGVWEATRFNGHNSDEKIMCENEAMHNYVVPNA